MFLEYLTRKLVFDQKVLAMVNPRDYLAGSPPVQRQQPTMSSWGAEGYGMVWLNGRNDWLYRHQHIADERMVELAGRYPDAAGLLQRRLNQAARELLLAQSSDWAFILTTGTMVPYAVKRFKDHINRFTTLYQDIHSGNPAEEGLREMEARDTIFPEIDYRVYR